MDLSLDGEVVEKRAERLARKQLREAIDSIRESQGIDLRYNFSAERGLRLSYSDHDSTEAQGVIRKLHEVCPAVRSGWNLPRTETRSRTFVSLDHVFEPTRSDRLAAQRALSIEADRFLLYGANIVGSKKLNAGLSFEGYMELHPFSTDCLGESVEGGSLVAHLRDGHTQQRGRPNSSPADCDRLASLVGLGDARRLLDAALAILEWHHLHRDSWARDRVALPNGKELRAEGAWLFVPTSFMASRLFPGKRANKSQHGPVGRVLAALAMMGVLGPDDEELQVLPFLASVLDCTNPRVPPRSHAESLALLLAAVDANDRAGFCIQFGRQALAGLLPHYTHGGTVHWGPDAAKVAKGAEDDPPSKPGKVVRSLNAQWGANKGYYNWSNADLLLAQLSGWDNSTKRLWLTILGNLALASRAERKEGPYMLILDEGTQKRLTPVTGSRGKSWLLPSWLKFAGYSGRPTKQGVVRSFADDLLLISSDTGLIVEVDGQDGREAIDVLRFTASRRTHWDKTAVHLYLPENFLQRIEERLIVLSAQRPAVHKNAWPPARLKKEISRSRTRNKELAAYLEVSASLVSQWLVGNRPVAVHHHGGLSQFFREKKVKD
ncbi:MAG: hypothetical protein IH609_17790 [Dehalococcoidia bacterium]|nr:hypothetical protein [Dehalococcoidia bacterium]